MCRRTNKNMYATVQNLMCWGTRELGPCVTTPSCPLHLVQIRSVTPYVNASRKRRENLQ